MSEEQIVFPDSTVEVHRVDLGEISQTAEGIPTGLQQGNKVHIMDCTFKNPF